MRVHGHMAMAIVSYATLPGVWEVSGHGEVATFSAASGMGVVIYDIQNDLWVTHWIELSDGSSKKIIFKHPANAIGEIESHTTL